MSAQVTIQRTFTTTTTSALLVNVGYVKTLPGLLKIFQLALGCIIIGIDGHYFGWNSYHNTMVPELFLLLIATTCLITTALLLFSCLFSISTASILPKTLFEMSYHIVSTILYVAGGIALLVILTEYKRSINNYEIRMAAAVLALVNAGLYLMSTIYSVRTFRRG